MDAAGVATDVSQLASILFHVSSLDGDGEDIATRNLDVDGSFERDRLVILRGLKVFGKVWIEVVLAREAAVRRNRASE